MGQWRDFFLFFLDYLARNTGVGGLPAAGIQHAFGSLNRTHSFAMAAKFLGYDALAMVVPYIHCAPRSKLVFQMELLERKGILNYQDFGKKTRQ